MATMNQELKALASFLCVSCGKITIDEKDNIPSIRSNGLQLTGLATVAKHLTRQSKNKQLLGGSPEEEAQIAQWLEFRVNVLDRCADKKELETALDELNEYLSTRVYFVGYSLTLADVFMYFGLHYIFSKLTFYEKQVYMHVSRWFDHIQNTSGVQQKMSKIYFQRNILYTEGSH